MNRKICDAIYHCEYSDFNSPMINAL
jgi:hypothetical protein